jgi:hypothetical protein
MTREEANHLLEEHKLGIRIHTVVEVTKALWVTGDLKGIPRHAKPLSPDGINAGMERTRLVSGEGT